MLYLIKSDWRKIYSWDFHNLCIMYSKLTKNVPYCYELFKTELLFASAFLNTWVKNLLTSTKGGQQQHFNKIILFNLFIFRLISMVGVK